MLVLKFGGSSLADSQRFVNVANIIRHTFFERDGEISVVLSAVKGTTDSLLKAAFLAEKSTGRFQENKQKSQPLYKKQFTAIKQKHWKLWKELWRNLGEPQKEVPSDIITIFSELEELLDGISFVKECTLRTKDFILSFGERLSCKIMWHYLQALFSSESGKKKLQKKDIQYIDARDCIVTNNSFGEASVLFSTSYRKIKILIQKKIHVITGFIASTQTGITTTLGRNGSDYSAALVGAALQASQIEIWTDVDGVLSADPKIVPKAFVVPKVNYSEAMELSYFGAKVIHPNTLVPVLEKNIPIVIKNTLNPKASGTYIWSGEKHKTQTEKRSMVTGIASTRDVSLLLVEGVGLSGNFYFLPRIFTVFAEHHIKPLMITQSSSEHSICFVVRLSDEHKIVSLLKKQFTLELKQKKIQSITAQPNVSIISVIGARMRGIRGLAGRIFNTMGLTNINIIAIAQGSNEINVSFVVKKDDEHRALQVLHKEFF